MSRQRPFFPPGMGPPVAQESVGIDLSVPAPPCGPGHLWCVACRKELRQGSHCLEILVGKVGRGTKSGQAMVVPDEELEQTNPGTNNPVLCWDCAIPWMDEEFYGGAFFEEQYLESTEGYGIEEDEDDQR